MCIAQPSWKVISKYPVKCLQDKLSKKNTDWCTCMYGQQSILSDLPQLEERTLSRIVRGNASGWLTVLPLKREGMICPVQNSAINLPFALVGSRLPCQRNVMVAGSPSLSSMALTARKVDLSSEATMICVIVMQS